MKTGPETAIDVPRLAQSQHFTAGFNNPEEVLDVITDIPRLDPGEPASPADAGILAHYEPLTLIELSPQPLIASTANLLERTKEVIGMVLDWSTLRGEEVREYRGNRIGDELMGPAILRFPQAPLTEPARVTAARANRVVKFLVKHKVCGRAAAVKMVRAQ